ncbi:hypothetical protein BC831DRAFT_278752 [Entophlyctis helioformis]|nr:hypothetical protein BC831DRAFT_278752 [Entophlyctis helioformis]
MLGPVESKAVHARTIKHEHPMPSEFSGVARERFLSPPWTAVCCGLSLCLSLATPDPCLCPLCCRCSVPRRVDRCCSARRSGCCCCTVSRARRSSSSSRPFKSPRTATRAAAAREPVRLELQPRVARTRLWMATAIRLRLLMTTVTWSTGSWRLMPAIHGVQGRWWFRQMQADSQDLIAAIHQSLALPYRGYHGTIA